MRLITRFELARVSNGQLAALFTAVSGEMARTPARRNALASLENIRREQAARRAQPRP